MRARHCRECGKKMQRWGRSPQNKPRFFCPDCGKTTTRSRDDLHRDRNLRELREWLVGKESLAEIAKHRHLTRQALWKRFRPVMKEVAEEELRPEVKPRILILDGTYIHGNSLCVLVAIDEADGLYWKFSYYESYASWCDFLSDFGEPEIVIIDGQKGLFAAVKTLWPKVAIQRCQFHLVAFAMHYLGRNPQEEVGQALMEILYGLKYAKTCDARDEWIKTYFNWEKKYAHLIGAKDAMGRFLRPRLRSARFVIRRALPHLFTFLNYPGAPNTTNLVEGWVNGAIAESLRLHRGLRVNEKKALVTSLLSGLSRGKYEKEKMEELCKKRAVTRSLFFIKKYFKTKSQG